MNLCQWVVRSLGFDKQPLPPVLPNPEADRLKHKIKRANQKQEIAQERVKRFALRQSQEADEALSVIRGILSRFDRATEREDKEDG